MFLEISGIKKHFGDGESRVEVLKGIDLEIQKGEICVLLGASGSGKSTLLNIIGGIDDADSGYISINGEKTADMSEKKLTLYRRKHLGYIFQMYNLIPNLNIKENVEVSKIVIEKNAQSISMTKILGYFNSEISRLYIMSTSIVVVICLLLSLPIEYYAMKWMFINLMMTSMSGWITFYVEPMIYIEMFIIGILTYAVIAVLQYRKIKKVPLAEALKNAE